MNAQQLKNSILQMAVRGKLVPQDPSDEPASVLLERIREEKAAMVKAGKIKKEKNSSVIFRGEDNLFYEQVGNGKPVCIADELPFEIPESWEWVRLSAVNDLYTGNSISEGEKARNFTGLSNGRYYIGTKDLSFNHEINYDNGVRIPLTFEKYRVAPQHSILMCIEGGSAGRKIAFTNQDVCFGNKLCCFISHGINSRFIYYYLQSPIFQIAFKKNKTGIIGGVSINILKSMFLPVPPLNEQERIIETVNNIIPYLENYNQTYTELSTLNSSFPTQLKKSILQQAVQGKLVPQDPSDEPASVLLKRIRKEKERLIKEGKIKRDKHESIIYRRDNSHYEMVDGAERCIDEEIPFEIPKSWEWCRLGEIGITNIGLTYRPTDKVDIGGIPVLRSNNIQNGKIELNNVVYVSCNVPERATIEQGDILVCARNGSRNLVGKSAIIEKGKFAFGAFMAKYTSYLSKALNPYILLFLESPVFRKQLDGIKTETINQITQDTLKNQLFPLPPLAEQHRIVAKLDELLSKVQRL